MSEITVAIVGTGPHPDDGGEGYSMGYRHAHGYVAVDDCELVGCADLVSGHARAFADEFGLSPDRVFGDHETLLATVEPDLVSVCTPPSTHPEIVADCATAGPTRAVHCEKPMAVTWGESRDMVATCRDASVQLTFNLQSRYSEAAQRAKELIDEGAIGDLRRLELSRPDLLQTGIHNVSLAHYFNDDRPVDSVTGQVEYGSRRVWYTDMYSEDASIGCWTYDNGVEGLVRTGDEFGLVDAYNRVVGTDGVIEIDPRWDRSLQVRRGSEAAWEEIDTDAGTSSPDAQRNALAAVVRALETGERSRLDAEIVLAASEVVFAIWESARRRGRVDLPLEIEGNPLAEMIETGE